jgi:hypothetical protein
MGPENKEKRVPFKSVDEVKADFGAKVTELNIEPGTSQILLNFLLEENRMSWIRGKEYGWKKAWEWKRKKQTA